MLVKKSPREIGRSEQSFSRILLRRNTASLEISVANGILSDYMLSIRSGLTRYSSDPAKPEANRGRRL